nr:BTB:POZ domain containing protein [Haemonchus contortus]
MSCTEGSLQETVKVEGNGRNTDSISSDINHTDTLSDDIGVLLGNRDFSDIILVVNGEKIPANKALLAAQVTFRGLLYGGLKESGEGEVVLNQTNVFAFRILLRYLYTAKIPLAEYKDDQLLEILGIAHQYCVIKLQNAIADHFKPAAVEVLKKHLILSQISRRDLLKIVWPSKLLASDIVLDVIDKQDEAELKLLRKLTEEDEKCPTTI